VAPAESTLMPAGNLKAEQMLFKVTDRDLQSAFDSSLKSVTEYSLSASEIDSLSDALAILAALDRSGNVENVESLLSDYHRLQSLNGEFRAGDGEIEGTGCALWSLVDHSRLTGEVNYLNSVYKNVRRGLRWIARNRTADGSKPHSGLMPERSNRPLNRYPAAFWTLAGTQEAARAASVLGKSGHIFEGESLFHELKRALLRSLDHTAGQRHRSGLPADPDSPPGDISASTLVALIPGDLFSPDFKHLSGEIELLCGQVDLHSADVSSSNGLSITERAALAHHLLRRGDGRIWDIIEPVLKTSITKVIDASYLFWLIRNMFVLDHHSTLLIAPAYALRPPEDGGIVELIDVPTYYGPVSYRLERSGEELLLEWRALQRRAPEYLIWPLPGVFLDSEPPTITLTGSRMGIHLDPGGGRLKVRLVAGTLT
jgi:hypothetical protein